MNFALSGIIIIVLLLPGAISLKAYYSAFKHKESSRSIPLSDLLIKGVVWSLIFHVSILCFISFLGFTIDFHFFYNVLIGNPSKDFTYDNYQFNRYVKQFISYILLLVFGGWASAKLLRYIVRTNRWDISFNGFTNYNYWFYIFSDAYSEGSRKNDRRSHDLIYVDVMTALDVIYCGILIDFNYSPEKDELENIVIEGARRRTVDKQDAKVLPPIPVPGDILVINMKDVLNINVKYLEISESKTQSSQPESPGTE